MTLLRYGKSMQCKETAVQSRHGMLNNHRFEFSLGSVVDQKLVEWCFQGQPTEINLSDQMVAGGLQKSTTNKEEDVC